MDLTPFKRDIDELINEFSKCNSTTLADMKRIWLSRKFTFIYETRPTSNEAFFMQTLFAHSIGYMISADSLSQRLGGLYCLYCLFGTQPFKPPFKVYLSLGEMKKLKDLVVRAKEQNIMVVPALVKRMLESNMFLYGAAEMNHLSITERLDAITNQLNAGVRIAYEKLFAEAPIDRSVNMDLGMEVGIQEMKKMSEKYTAAKELAINEASKMVDVQDIKPITENKKSAADVVEKIAGDWNTQKELFYQKTRFNRAAEGENQVVCYQPDGAIEHSPNQEEEEGDEEFTQELEDILSGNNQ